ncbi:Rad60-SLD domain-containing protein [Cephalotus follicularis]|uniref:Rad60-SLD domain-containing protein n=1 Tax=Cephalotus follicularis TaxID=3775 RepID=A0A1Q3CVX4_CEPFO|nr:Rad60-SLD domain-containing protein [Cephalotus follicularis]
MDGQRYFATKETIITFPIGKDDNSVILRVQKQKVDDVIYRIGRKTPMRRLMLDYCVRMGFVYETVKFSFDGSRLSMTQTADDLELEDDDIIDAWSDQIGGCRRLLIY